MRHFTELGKQSWQYLLFPKSGQVLPDAFPVVMHSRALVLRVVRILHQFSHYSVCSIAMFLHGIEGLRAGRMSHAATRCIPSIPWTGSAPFVCGQSCWKLACSISLYKSNLARKNPCAACARLTIIWILKYTYDICSRLKMNSNLSF